MRALLFLVASAFAYHHRDAIPSLSPIPEEMDPEYWYNEAFDGIDRIVEEEMYEPIARNIIFFLGDGLSLPTLAAARALRGQRDGRPGEETRMSHELWPATGLAKTYCLNAQIADSACTATAYLCGVKNNDYTIGVTGKVARGDCAVAADPANRLDSLLAWAIDSGKAAGIVTTTRVTHASPAGAYARTSHRYYESDQDVLDHGASPGECPDIAHQLIHTSPGNQFKVILGGGRREFRPNTFTDEEGASGRRADGRDLVEEWKALHAGSDSRFVWNRTALLEAADHPPQFLLGLFESGHMQYEAEAGPEEPTLSEMTSTAIKILSPHPGGFVLFVEGGRIDHAHHDNLVQLALEETLGLADAVEAAELLLQRRDTLFLLSADHSHVMAYNGYSPRGNPILGTAQSYQALDELPYQTLSYTNGPGARERVDGARTESLKRRTMTLSYTNGPGARERVDGARTDVTQEEDYGSLHWMAHVDVPIEWETHGGEDVAVFAKGPQHHLFVGSYEQSGIPHRAAYAACIGPAAKRRVACRARNAAARPRPFFQLQH